MVQTASMAYHDSLWVAVAAAAPVIALTTIVSYSDTSTAYQEFWERLSRYLSSTGLDNLKPEVDQLLGRQRRRLGRLTMGSSAIALLNICWQLLLLFLALWSLAEGKDEASAFFTAFAVPLGVFLLLWGTVLNLRLRGNARSVPPDELLDKLLGGPPSAAAMILRRFGIRAS